MNPIEDLSKKLREARLRMTGCGAQLFINNSTGDICYGELDNPKENYPLQMFEDDIFIVLVANNIVPILDELDRLIQVEKVLRDAMNQMTEYVNGFNEKEAHHELCCQVPDLAMQALNRADEIGKKQMKNIRLTREDLSETVLVNAKKLTPFQKDCWCDGFDRGVSESRNEFIDLLNAVQYVLANNPDNQGTAFLGRNSLLKAYKEWANNQ